MCCRCKVAWIQWGSLLMATSFGGCCGMQPRCCVVWRVFEVRFSASWSSMWLLIFSWIWFIDAHCSCYFSRDGCSIVLPLWRGCSLMVMFFNQHKREKYSASGKYKLSCLDCNKVFIGQTGGGVLQRFKEHYVSLRSNNTSSNFSQRLLENSHFRTHRQNHGHLTFPTKRHIHEHSGKILYSRTSNNGHSRGIQILSVRRCTLVGVRQVIYPVRLKGHPWLTFSTSLAFRAPILSLSLSQITLYNWSAPATSVSLAEPRCYYEWTLLGRNTLSAGLYT
jgi:hypothetical protein